ncbi:MAG: hypothetical protein WBC06_18595 [Chitinophagaceae bacterium]
MKIAPLLAQYLYSRKHLELPGIGVFLLDSSFNPEPEHTKNAKPSIIEGISFEYNTLVRESPDLIQFISDNTGKIKPLASADLDSHLELAKQFINIGKPFLFEGIGSLSKVQSGGLAFNPGFLITEKLTEYHQTGNSSAIDSDEPATDYKNIFRVKKEKTNWKKPTIVLLLLAGIVLAIWGGYMIYKGSTTKDELTSQEADEKAETLKTTDTQTINKTDTSAINTPINTIIPSGNYKFIVETANKERGLKRFNTLKGYGLDILMETTDSLNFKLFFILPSSIADTTRIIDSLRKIYTPAGNTAYIEN